ncbi:hypothetical protein [Halopseudomonas pelagia]|uniref:Uncharacterized protein n=1 Tax=Halopseudomonas pelagia TaxID=553151 RepID=A0AA91Z7E9_9GAMM|nr:hypothetical protein [Halopseudomonas pelagia]PCD00968.1 hypothetical protein CO192_02680 [Halopseudomonas pelagia]QFY57608.1 hypothetical protein EAO82_15260 [Halopseudomonas pelagia]
MKGTLTLRSRELPSGDEQSVDVVIGVYDALLAGRNYKIEHKVAEVGKVSQSTEFLLRLIHSVDGMPEADVTKFFDFSPQEMTYLLNDAVNLGYVSRDSGRLWTTRAGRDLFVAGGEEPQIFNVEKRTWNFGFDLISFAPQDSVRTTAFDHCLHSLEVDHALVSKGKEQIPASFKRHFTELNTKQGSRALLKRSLYSIDSVTPGDKFSALVPVVVKSPQAFLHQGEPDLLEWRPEHELDDRVQVATAIGKFVEDLRLHVPESAVDDYKILMELAPEFLRSYTLKTGFSVERYQRDAVAVKDHKFQKRRKTIAIIGPFFTPINSAVLDLAVTRAVNYTPATCLPRKFYWHAPRRPYWGTTRVLPTIIQRVQDQIAEKLGSEEQKPSAVLLLERSAQGPHKAFTEKQHYLNDSPPQSVEIFLVPGVAAGVLIHLPGSSTIGHAVPVGFMSLDPLVVSRTENYLKQYGSIEVPEERVSEEDIDLLEE